MKKIISAFLSLALLPLVGCHDPEELVAPVGNHGINNLTVYASWEGYHTADESGFSSSIDYDKHVITVEVPYTLPVESDNVQKLEDYTKMYALFNLDDNVTIEPMLYTLDLTQTYDIVITDQQKIRTPWKIKATLKKSSACDIESFTIRGLDVSALIDKNSGKASLIYFKELKNVFADYELSPHARIVPDPAKTSFFCSPSEPKKFTVIAQDGVTKREWLLEQTTPQKVESGLNPQSGKLLWTKKLSQVGVASLNKTNGIGATEEHLVVNVQDQNPIILSMKNGNVEGQINLGQWAGHNYYLTSDDAGHILINNFANGSDKNPAKMQILRMKSVYDTPEPFIEFDMTGVYGKKISVTGDVYGDAVIATVYSGWSPTGSTSLLTWTIRNGVVENMKPAWRQASGVKGWTNGDAVYTEPSFSSDYFVATYSGNKLSWVDGGTSSVKASIFGKLTGNEQMLAVDCEKFNGVNYVITSMETSFTWGVSGSMWVVEAKYPQTFSGQWDVSPASTQPSAMVYALDRGPDGYGKYGGRLNDGQNSNAYTDVVLHQSEDGYFLYAYFMFCNGYVGCVQFDCIAK